MLLIKYLYQYIYLNYIIKKLKLLPYEYNWNRKISNNNLKTLPEELSTLKKLEKLYINNIYYIYIKIYIKIILILIF